MNIQKPKPAQKFILVHTNSRNQRWFFVALGSPWPYRPERRMITSTTQDREKAKVFDTVPEALAILETAGDPPGWTVEAA